MPKTLKALIFLFLISNIIPIQAQLAKPRAKEKKHYIMLETIYGNMKIKLYNETPLHRDNFIKLVSQGFYESLLFHRVIKDFMIQGGDPDSKGAKPEKQLGNGGPGYKIPAEFVPSYFHKKGVIAAAREGDNINPDKESSGSQFYIVQGTVFTKEQLTQMEERMNMPKKQKFFYDYMNRPENSAQKAKLDSLSKIRANEELNKAIQQIAMQLEPEMQKLGLFHFTDEQIQAYTTLGGAPHLDQNYTVFGEVVEGLNVIDSIAQVKTGKFDRPVTDVIMKMKVLKN